MLRKGLQRTIAEGVEQTRSYMDRCGAEADHLIVFDRAPERTWAEKIFRRAPSVVGVPVTVWGSCDAFDFSIRRLRDRLRRVRHSVSGPE